MSDEKLSKVQRFFLAIFPASWGRSMEESSRSWIVRCPNCNFERSVWELGGIRWKAAGNPKQKLLCPNCQQLGWHTIYRKQV
jgi:ssDNA-binding Zn-finger/Zn-ribbon topoisomerase 1